MRERERTHARKRERERKIEKGAEVGVRVGCVGRPGRVNARDFNNVHKTTTNSHLPTIPFSILVGLSPYHSGCGAITVDAEVAVAVGHVLHVAPWVRSSGGDGHLLLCRTRLCCRLGRGTWVASHDLLSLLHLLDLCGVCRHASESVQQSVYVRKYC